MVIVIRCIAVLAILVGCFYSLSASARLQRLKSDNRELRALTGDLQIGDPNRVHVVAIRDTKSNRGVDEGIIRMWRFRIYYPKAYQANYFLRSDWISTNSPRASGSGASSFNNTPLAEPAYDTMTFTITKSESGLKLSRVSDDSSGETSLPAELDFAEPDNIIIETVSSPDEGTVSFPPDQPICMLRIRDKQNSRRWSRRDKDPLYRGFYFYVVPQVVRGSFESQARRKTGS